MNAQNNPITEPLYRPATSREAIFLINWRCSQRLFPNDNKEVGCGACGLKKIPRRHLTKDLADLFQKVGAHHQLAN